MTAVGREIENFDTPEIVRKKCLCFDVITSLVSIEYGGYGCEKVTSQCEDEIYLTLTSLRVISMVRGHVIVT
jgi:hypothetical protein